MLYQIDFMALGLLLFVSKDNLPTHIFDLSAPLITGLLLYLAVSTDKLNHLGEAYRYIEYGLIFTLPIIASLTISNFANQFH